MAELRRRTGDAVQAPAADVQARRLLDRFGENLIEMRRLSGRSQAEVARRADLHRTEIGLLERGGRMPGLDTVIRLSAGVAAEPDRLFDGLFWTLDPDRYEEAPRGRFIIEGRVRP